jgi:hypothetical protein
MNRLASIAFLDLRVACFEKVIPLLVLRALTVSPSTKAALSCFELCLAEAGIVGAGIASSHAPILPARISNQRDCWNGHLSI